MTLNIRARELRTPSFLDMGGDRVLACASSPETGDLDPSRSLYELLATIYADGPLKDDPHRYEIISPVRVRDAEGVALARTEDKGALLRSTYARPIVAAAHGQSGDLSIQVDWRRWLGLETFSSSDGKRSEFLASHGSAVEGYAVKNKLSINVGFDEIGRDVLEYARPWLGGVTIVYHGNQEKDGVNRRTVARFLNRHPSVGTLFSLR